MGVTNPWKEEEPKHPLVSPAGRPHFPLMQAQQQSERSISKTSGNPLTRFPFPRISENSYILYLFVVVVTRHLYLPRWTPALDPGMSCPPQALASHTTLPNVGMFPGNPKLLSLLCTLSLDDLLGHGF